MSVDAIRLAIYYNESGEQVVDIVKAGVESGYFEEEDSFSPIEMDSLKANIVEALPLMYQQLFEFGQSVYQSLLIYDNNTTLVDAEYEEYSQLSGFSRFVLIFWFSSFFLLLKWKSTLTLYDTNLFGIFTMLEIGA